MSENYSREKMAELEKSRTISDAELLKEGAEYDIDDKGNRTLIVPKHSIRTARVKRNREVKLPEQIISKEKETGDWKDWTVAVMSASSDRNFAASQNTYGIGKLVAENGYDSINGGYGVGGMKRYADGFREKCKELGIPDEEIKDHLKGVIWSEEAIGQFLKTERGVNETATIYEADNLGERAGGIIYRSDAIIAVEGGVGTELETLMASQNEWFVETYNKGLDKEIAAMESDGQLTEKKRAEILSRRRTIRPVISIDSTDMFKHICQLAEKKSPGTVNTLAANTYIFESHPRTDEMDPKNKALLAKEYDELLTLEKKLKANEKELPKEQIARVLELGNLLQPMATVDNDEKIQKQLSMILEMHYLMDLKDRASTEQLDRIEELEYLIHGKDSEYRVKILSEIIKEEGTDITGIKDRI